ncbi:MAG: hypothetical protein AAF525_00455 [Pseudomonadota bacterium]
MFVLDLVGSDFFRSSAAAVVFGFVTGDLEGDELVGAFFVVVGLAFGLTGLALFLVFVGALALGAGFCLAVVFFFVAARLFEAVVFAFVLVVATFFLVAGFFFATDFFLAGAFLRAGALAFALVLAPAFRAGVFFRDAAIISPSAFWDGPKSSAHITRT